MRIAVIGAGAMGSVYGGLLSERNEVWLIDSRSELGQHPWCRDPDRRSVRTDR